MAPRLFCMPVIIEHTLRAAGLLRLLSLKKAIMNNVIVIIIAGTFTPATRHYQMVMMK